MGPCCAERKDALGTFKGGRDENQIESKQQDELYEIIRGEDNEIGKRKTERDYELLLRCPRCGQLWRTQEFERGGSRYWKVSETEARQLFPDAWN